MRAVRALGVRSQLLGAMVVLAVASVAVTAVLVNRAVDIELRALARRDVRVSAVDAAALALHGRTFTAERPAAPTTPGALDAAARHLDRRLQARMTGLLATAGVAAGSLALLLALAIALRLARPLRRLTDVARRMGAGELETRAADPGGGREIARLAQTMDHLAETLRRQDEIRRATASDVTHELRGALVGVVARVEELRMDAAADPAAVLGAIDGDVRRLHRLVDDVDRLAEAQRPGLLVSKRPIGLDEIVAACAARWAERCAARAVGLTDRIAHARVEGDPERLGQVVDNLLSNALRYTDPGGRIAVSLRVDDGDAVIVVADSGIGIPREQLARIFDRFWRAPEARARAAHGSGVGLALVADLVAAHDGRVEVASRPGRGSTFAVRLPLCDAPPAAAAAAAAAARAPATPGLGRAAGALRR